MTPTLLKLMLTPLLIASATLAGRWWGPAVGGLIVGLPLTSGPVSVFLTLERGPVFAADAARGALLGSLAVTAFCVAYARCAPKLSWPASLAVSFCCYALSLTALSALDLSLLRATLLVLALTLAALPLAGRASGAPRAMLAPRWDLPFRMVAATGVVLVITLLSQRLGPRLSGLLSAFPVFVSVMNVFSHALHGGMAARRFSRGVIAGSFSFAVFFVVVALCIERLRPAPAYGAACAAAVAVNLAVFRLMEAAKKPAARRAGERRESG